MINSSNDNNFDIAIVSLRASVDAIGRLVPRDDSTIDAVVKRLQDAVQEFMKASTEFNDHQLRIEQENSARNAALYQREAGIAGCEGQLRVKESRIDSELTLLKDLNDRVAEGRRLDGQRITDEKEKMAEINAECSTLRQENRQMRDENSQLKNEVITFRVANSNATAADLNAARSEGKAEAQKEFERRRVDDENAFKQECSDKKTELAGYQRRLEESIKQIGLLEKDVAYREAMNAELQKRNAEHAKEKQAALAKQRIDLEQNCMNKLKTVNQIVKEAVVQQVSTLETQYQKHHGEWADELTSNLCEIKEFLNDWIGNTMTGEFNRFGSLISTNLAQLARDIGRQLQQHVTKDRAIQEKGIESGSTLQEIAECSSNLMIELEEIRRFLKDEEGKDNEASDREVELVQQISGLETEADAWHSRYIQKSDDYKQLEEKLREEMSRAKAESAATKDYWKKRAEECEKSLPLANVAMGRSIGFNFGQRSTQFGFTAASVPLPPEVPVDSFPSAGDTVDDEVGIAAGETDIAGQERPGRGGNLPTSTSATILTPIPFVPETPDRSVPSLEAAHAQTVKQQLQPHL